MTKHDKSSCPICNGRKAQLELEGFEGWNNPERFKVEIRIAIHKIAELEKLLEG